MECPVCKARINTPDAMFCHVCGANLQQVAPPPNAGQAPVPPPNVGQAPVPPPNMGQSASTPMHYSNPAYPPNQNMAQAPGHMYQQQYVPPNQAAIPPQRAKKKNSGMSIAAFITSLLGCFGIVGLILGIIDLARGKPDKKHGLSIAAVIIGGLMLIVTFAAANSISNSSSDTANRVATESVTVTSDGGVATESGTVTSGDVITSDELENVYEDITVGKLMSDLESNALKAADLYKDNYYAVTGRLSNIDASGKYISIVDTETAYAIRGVQCYVKTNEIKEIVRELSIDEVIIVRGKITSVGEVLAYSMDIDSIDRPVYEDASINEGNNASTDEDHNDRFVYKDANINEGDDTSTGEGNNRNNETVTQNQGMTSEQSNALSSAKKYLNYSAFSYDGLVEQLIYEGYDQDAASFAADNCGADWNEQALKSAKNYLSYTAFSYTGLIKQLQYEKFSDEQAKYGADNCNADWNEQAAKSAENYLSYSTFSRSGLIEQLLYEGFTAEQAEYGVSQVYD